MKFLFINDSKHQYTFANCIFINEGEGNFDAVVTNVDVEKCIAEVMKTFQGWYPDFDLDISAAES